MQQDEPTYYRITIGGELDPTWADWLGVLSLRSSTGADGRPVTILTAPVADQAALRGILVRIWDLNLELIAVERLGR